MWPFSRKDQAPDEAKSLQALEEFFAAAQGTASKITVSPSKALECVPVRASVQLRCETLSSLPLRLFQRLPDGGKEKAIDHPLYPLLHGRANGWTSSTDFVSALERDTLLTGHGYALANRIDGGRIAELVRLAPERVKVETDAGDEPTYVVTLPPTNAADQIPCLFRGLNLRNLPEFTNSLTVTGAYYLNFLT